ncbi:MAG: HNH endonuclease [Patescibacteria group bacterium]|nr:HNH endonuclease [Patescibacteria group bacterium]
MKIETHWVVVLPGAPAMQKSAGKPTASAAPAQKSPPAAKTAPAQKQTNQTITVSAQSTKPASKVAPISTPKQETKTEKHAIPVAPTPKREPVKPPAAKATSSVASNQKLTTRMIPTLKQKSTELFVAKAASTTQEAKQEMKTETKDPFFLEEDDPENQPIDEGETGEVNANEGDDNGAEGDGNGADDDAKDDSVEDTADEAVEADDAKDDIANNELIDETKEIWRDIEMFPGYKVSNLGNIIGAMGRTFETKPRSDGYKSISVRKNGKRVSVQTHILVAKAFVPNPNNHTIVDHVNRIRHDNRASNLRWVTRRENNMNREIEYGNRVRPVVQLNDSDEIVKEWKSVKAVAEELDVATVTITKAIKLHNKVKERRLEYKDAIPLDGEEWKETVCKNKQFLASNMGRVKLPNASRRATFGSPNSSGYMMYLGCQVHRIVALAWCDKPEGKNIVNHLSGNKADNRAVNLAWTTNQENVLHAFANGAFKDTKPVRYTDEHGKTTTFRSVNEASKKLKANYRHIADCCNHPERHPKGRFRFTTYTKKR